MSSSALHTPSSLAGEAVLKDKRVLELGSGAGFLGILVGQLQLETQSGGTLIMTDVNSEVLERCALNLDLDCSECRSQSRKSTSHDSVSFPTGQMALSAIRQSH